MTTCRELLEEWLAAEEAIPGYMGTAKHPDIMRRLERTRAFLAQGCDAETLMERVFHAALEANGPFEAAVDDLSRHGCDNAETYRGPMERLRAACRPPCQTCGGTRVAPVSDEDLGGKGVTMSSCPECASD